MIIIRQKEFAKYEGIVNGVKQTFKNKKAFNKSLRNAKFGGKSNMQSAVAKEPDRVSQAIDFNSRAKGMLKGTAEEGKGVYGLAGKYKKEVENVAANSKISDQNMYDNLNREANAGSKEAKKAFLNAKMDKQMGEPLNKRSMASDYNRELFKSKFNGTQGINRLANKIV